MELISDYDQNLEVVHQTTNNKPETTNKSNYFPTSTWADGDPVYLGATAGTITKTKPHAPNHLVYLGFVTTASNGSAGRLYVRVQNGYEMDEIHDVSAQTPNNGDTLIYNSTTSLWESNPVIVPAGMTWMGAFPG